MDRGQFVALSATAAQLTTAIDSRMQQVAHERAQQRLYWEHQRLARELHDSVAIDLQHHLCSIHCSSLKRDPLEGQSRVDRLLELSQTALREMRSLLFELHIGDDKKSDVASTLTGSERVERYGLLDALHLLAGDFSNDGVHVNVEVQGYPPTYFNSWQKLESKPMIEEVSIASPERSIMPSSCSCSSSHYSTGWQQT
jgi:signal transduction histidine kinase